MAVNVRSQGRVATIRGFSGVLFAAPALVMAVVTSLAPAHAGRGALPEVVDAPADHVGLPPEPPEAAGSHSCPSLRLPSRKR